MIVFKTRYVKWYLEDERISQFLLFSEEKGERRSYRFLELGEERFFIKRFDEKGIGGLLRNLLFPRGKKEFFMGKRLLNLSIPVPEPFGYGISRRGSYVIQRFEEGKTLKEVFRREEDFMRAIALFLKKLNENHILHRDLHPENVLVKDGKIILLDLHKAKIKRIFLKRDALLNLAQLLGPFFYDLTEEEKRPLFDILRLSDERPLRKKIEDLRRRWIKRKEKRAFRTTSKIIAKNDTLFVRGMKELEENLFEEVKRDKKVLVERYSDHIRKYYRGRGRWKRAWKNHVILLYMDLLITPKPFFAKKPSFFSPPFIALEDLKGKGEELDRFLSKTYSLFPYERKKELARRLADFFLFLFKKGIFHKDLKACNIFVLSDGTFRLLDVEDIVFKIPKRDDLKRFFVQLNCSIPERIGLKERLRFFLHLCRNLNIEWQSLLSEVIKKSLKKEIVYNREDGPVIERWEKRVHL